MLKSIALVLAFTTACWSEAKPQPVQSQPQPTQIEPKKITVKDIVQPVKIEKMEQATDDGDEEDGEVGGVEGGVVGGVIGPPPPPPPPPPPAPPLNVSPAALEGSRVAGTKLIEPDAKTKAEIAASGKDKVIASFKLCVATDGSVASVTMLKTSGFPSYDAKLTSTIRATWKYAPYYVNGNPTAVCTAVTFIYASS